MSNQRPSAEVVVCSKTFFTAGSASRSSQTATSTWSRSEVRSALSDSPNSSPSPPKISLGKVEAEVDEHPRARVLGAVDEQPLVRRHDHGAVFPWNSGCAAACVGDLLLHVVDELLHLLGLADGAGDVHRHLVPGRAVVGVLARLRHGRRDLREQLVVLLGEAGVLADDQVGAQRGDLLDLDAVGVLEHLGQLRVTELVGPPTGRCSPARRRTTWSPPTGTIPSASRASCSVRPTQTTRVGAFSSVVSPYLCAIVDRERRLLALLRSRAPRSAGSATAVLAAGGEQRGEGQGGQAGEAAGGGSGVRRSWTLLGCRAHAGAGQAGNSRGALPRAARSNIGASRSSVYSRLSGVSK